MLAMSTDAGRHPKLPVFRTVWAAYRLTLQHFGTFLRIAWPWLLVLTAAIVVLTWIAWSVKDTGSILPRLFNEIAVDIVVLIAGCAIAVVWHNHLLADLRTTPRQGSLGLMSGTLWRYVGIVLLTFVPVIPLYFMPDSAGEDETLLGALLLAAAVLLIPAVLAFAFARFGLILPAIALSRADVTLLAVWRATRGSGVRFLVGLFLTLVLPFLTVMAAAVFLIIRQVGFDAFQAGLESYLDITDEVSGPRSLQLAIIVNVSAQLVGIIIGMFAVSFLSVAFRHYFGRSDETPTAAQPA